jgi:hypothetical protein
MGLHRTSGDVLGPLTAYGQHLLHLGESQELLILNGFPNFPDSRFFTCWPLGGGVSVVDYVLSGHNLLPFIHHFFISPIPLADHALLSFSLRADTPLPPHSLPKVHPALSSASTRGTRMPFLPTSDRCSPSRLSSPYSMPLPNMTTSHPPFGMQPSNPTRTPPSPLLPPQNTNPAL